MLTNFIYVFAICCAIKPVAANNLTEWCKSEPGHLEAATRNICANLKEYRTQTAKFESSHIPENALNQLTKQIWSNINKLVYTYLASGNSAPLQGQQSFKEIHKEAISAQSSFEMAARKLFLFLCTQKYQMMDYQLPPVLPCLNGLEHTPSHSPQYRDEQKRLAALGRRASTEELHETVTALTHKTLTYSTLAGCINALRRHMAKHIRFKDFDFIRCIHSYGPIPHPLWPQTANECLQIALRCINIGLNNKARFCHSYCHQSALLLLAQFVLFSNTTNYKLFNLNRERVMHPTTSESSHIFGYLSALFEGLTITLKAKPPTPEYNNSTMEFKKFQELLDSLLPDWHSAQIQFCHEVSRLTEIPFEAKEIWAYQPSLPELSIENSRQLESYVSYCTHTTKAITNALRCITTPFAHDDDTWIGTAAPNDDGMLHNITTNR